MTYQSSRRNSLTERKKGCRSKKTKPQHILHNLEAIPGIQLREFNENRSLAKCCGGGGGLKAYNNDLAGDIAYRRALEALELEVDVIVSACPSCKSSLQQAAARIRKEKKGRLKVLDITEVVAEALA